MHKRGLVFPFKREPEPFYQLWMNIKCRIFGTHLIQSPIISGNQAHISTDEFGHRTSQFFKNRRGISECGKHTRNAVKALEFLASEKAGFVELCVGQCYG